MCYNQNNNNIISPLSLLGQNQNFILFKILQFYLMKNQLVNPNESVLKQETYFTQNFWSFNNALCPFNQPASKVCMNQQCDNENAFICNIQSCQCKNEHIDCVKESLKSLLQNIQSKKISTSSLETIINDEIERIIDFLSQYRDQAIIKIRKDLQLLGLNQNQKDFLNELRKNKTTGSKVWSIMHSERQQSSMMKIVRKTCQTMKTNFKKAKQSFEQTTKLINLGISQLDSKVQRFIFEAEITGYLKEKQEKLIHQEIQFSKSKVLSQLNQFKTIEDLFTPRTLKSAKLLYRAYENDFQARKFHQKCDGVADTFLLVETEFGKKIGGYTPLKWGSSPKSVNVRDESMSSFIFSLTNGDKFQLTDKQKAIKNYSSWGPLFGGDGNDLYICDKANKVVSSCGDVNSTYKNQKYKHKDKQSWRRFGGNSISEHFKVKQWQVWKVEFY